MKGEDYMSKTNIRSTSKQILEFILSISIDVGSFDVFITDEYIINEINGLNRNIYMLCFQYIVESGFIKSIRKDDDGSRLIRITPKAIDFVET